MSFKFLLIGKREEQRRLYNEFIVSIYTAKSGSDLKIILDKVYKMKWISPGREMFLMGLMQGALMQFNKDQSIEDLKEIFMTT